MCERAVKKNRTPAILWAIGILALSSAGPAAAKAAPADPARIPVSQATVSSEKNLVLRSQLIVRGTLEEHSQAYPTGRKEGTRRVVHYLQLLKVEDTWKGPSHASVQLLTSGVEPLPDAEDPLNRRYTGPLAGGEYVIFLQKAPGSEYYTLTGLWQGLYPLFGSTSVSLLANGGFPAFDQLSASQFKAKVQRLSASP